MAKATDNQGYRQPMLPVMAKATGSQTTGGQGFRWPRLQAARATGTGEIIGSRGYNRSSYRWLNYRWWPRLPAAKATVGQTTGC